MDISKVKAAISNAKNELKVAVEAEFKARQINGLKSLGSVDGYLDKALLKLDDAIERTTPKPKKEKAAKGK